MEMNEKQKQAAKDLDGLWGTGASDAITASVESTNALIEAAEEQVLPPGVSTADLRRISAITTALTAGFEFPVVRNEDLEPIPLTPEEHSALPEVQLTMNAAATLANGGRTVMHVYVSGMSEADVKKAEARLEKHDMLMGGANFLKFSAKKALREA